MGNTPVFAQTAGTKISPLSLMGKTFEQCEKVFGKPALVEHQRDRRAEVRYYKISVSGMTRIILNSPEKGAYNGNYSGKGNQFLIVERQFPKGQKTWQKAFAILGLSSRGVTASDSFTPDGKPLPNKHLDYQSDKYIVEWNPANKSDGHPMDDELTFTDGPPF